MRHRLPLRYEKRKEAPGGARIGAEHIERLSAIFRDRPVAIELHGGEPLTVGKDHMRSILHALAAAPNVQQVSMQTNGVQIDDEWLDMFDAIMPGLHLGISLDGDAEGNSWRVGYDAKPTYPVWSRRWSCYPGAAEVWASSPP